MDLSVTIVGMLLLLTLSAHNSMQQNPQLTITPVSAVSGSKVTFECKINPMGKPAAYFLLIRVQSPDGFEVAKYDQRCGSKPVMLSRDSKPGFENIESPDCSSFIVSDVTASAEMAGTYYCTMQFVNRDFSLIKYKSNSVELVVGDATPPVSLLEVRNAATNEQLLVGSEVPAKTNVSITCGTQAANPMPDVTITAGSNEWPPVKLGSSGRVTKYQLVPKQPNVAYRCQVYNGFGEKQTKDLELSAVYGMDHSAIKIPDKVTQQTSNEIEVCSLPNNPPKPLLVTMQDGDSLLQDGYPRYEAKNGYSRAYIKLQDSANPPESLTVTCGLASGAEEPVKQTIKLSGVEASTQGTSTTGSYSSSSAISTQMATPSSAMITIGIVIAVVVVFIIVVAGVAVALKRRSAANKASNNDRHYDKVEQNDGDPYVANAPGKKPVTVQG